MGGAGGGGGGRVGYDRSMTRIGPWVVVLGLWAAAAGCELTAGIKTRTWACEDYCALATKEACAGERTELAEGCVESCVRPAEAMPCKDTSFALHACESTLSCEQFRERFEHCKKAREADRRCESDAAGYK